VVDLPDLISRFVPLTREGNQFVARCPFHQDDGESLRVGDRWFCLGCEEQTLTRSDAAGFLMSWSGCSRELAEEQLGNGEFPEPYPTQFMPAKRLPFFGLKALLDNKTAKVWIHERAEGVEAGRRLVPSRVHLGLILGREWDNLGPLKDRTCVLLPAHRGDLLHGFAQALYADGRAKVNRIDPTTMPEGWYWPLDLDEASAYKWAEKHVLPYTNEAAQLASGPPSNSTELVAAASPLNAVPDVGLSEGGSPPPSAPATPGPHPSKGADVQPGRAKRGNGAAGPPLTPPERVAAQNAQARQEVLSGLVYTCIANVRPEAVKWLWPGRIPLGELTMIVGDPGLGKSQICASLASIVTNGGLWPVDRTPCEPGSVLILSAEDNIKHTIRPRLDAAGADVSKCHTLEAVKRYGDDGSQYEGSFNLAEDLAKLAVLMDHLQDIRLVIIDPVSAYLGGTDSHKNAEVRGMLAPLTALAGSRKAAIVLVSHLTKSQSASALMRVQGSIAFAALCRAVWGVTRDHDSQTRRLFMPLKNNLGQDKTGLAYEIESTFLEGIAEDEDQIATSRIMWETQPVEMGADEAFGAALSHEERSEVDDAKAFITETLSEGPVKASEVARLAKAAGHSHMTMARAKKAMRIVSAREGFGPGSVWFWRLKADKPEHEEPPPSWVPD
jgi:archaellum biogenesis ATPase FlaH